MKVLIADRFQQSYLGQIRKLGYDVDYRPDLTADDLAGAIAGVGGLVVRSTRVGAGLIGAADSLQIIVRAGAGVNTIDVQAAADHGIYVCNVPGRNAVAVAELAFGLLAAIDRRIPDAVADLRRGQWNKAEYAKATGLLGRHVGVVGLGEVGLAFAERAAAFGMHVYGLAKRRSPAAERRIAAIGIDLVDGLDALAVACDVISLHVPAGPETENLVDADFLEKLRPGTILLNTSRGELIDEKALLAALDEKDLRVGLDVFRDEPAAPVGPIDSPLARHPNVYGTHHIGASTEQAQQAIAGGVVDVLRAFREGRVIDCVNLETRTLGSVTLVVRHYDRVGVLSRVLATLRDAQLNIEQMENRIFAGATAACATLHLVGVIDEQTTEAIRADPDVIGVAIMEHP